MPAMLPNFVNFGSVSAQGMGISKRVHTSPAGLSGLEFHMKRPLAGRIRLNGLILPHAAISAALLLE